MQTNYECLVYEFHKNLCWKSAGLWTSLEGFLVLLAQVVDRFFLLQSVSNLVFRNFYYLCCRVFFVSMGSHSFSMVFTFLPLPRTTGSLLQNDFFLRFQCSTGMVFCSLLSLFLGWLFLTVFLILQRVLLVISIEDLFFLRIYSQMMFLYYFNESRWLSSTAIFTFSFEERSSYLLKNQPRQGCLRIYSIERRFQGSNYNILQIRSMHSSLALGTNSFLLHFFSLLSNLNTSCPALSFKLFISCSLGEPVHIITFQSWLRVEVPANRGFPRCISASRQPILQISIALVYLRDPTSIQGALYQRVAMYSVSTSCFSSNWSSIDLTSPKSHNFASQLQLTRTLEGFTSRWMRPAECRQYKALAIWQKIYFLCLSARMSSLMRVQRSMSMCSKTRQMSLLFSALMTSSSLMTWGWLNSVRNMISLQVLCASVELLKASKFFLRALTLRVRLSVTFQTCPQAPLPIFLRISNLARMWVSMSSLIIIFIVGSDFIAVIETNIRHCCY